MGQLFQNVRAIRAVFPALGTAADDVASSIDIVTNSTGLADKQFQDVADTSKFKIGKALSELKNQFIDLGSKLAEKVMPIFLELLDKVIEKLPGLIDAIMPWLEAMADNLGWLADLLFNRVLPAFEPLLPVLLDLAMMFKDVGQKIIEILVKALEIVLPVLVKLIDKLMPIIELVVQVADVILSLVDVLLDIFGPAISSLLDGPLGWLLDMLGWIADAIGTVIGWISDLIGWVGKFFGISKPKETMFDSTIQKGNELSSVFSSLDSQSKSVSNRMVSGFNQVGQAAKSAADDVIYLNNSPKSSTKDVINLGSGSSSSSSSSKSSSKSSSSSSSKSSSKKKKSSSKKSSSSTIYIGGSGKSGSYKIDDSKSLSDNVKGLEKAGVSSSTINDYINDATKDYVKHTSSSVIYLNDFIMSSNGQVYKTNPKDTIIGTKNPEGIGGVHVYIDKVQGLNAEEVAEALQMKLMNLVRP